MSWSGSQRQGGVKDVGHGIRTATFLDAAGGLFGVTDNPGFRVENS